MAATDPVITLADLVRIDAPAGTVRLCAGGFLDFDGARYESQHAVFGTIHEASETEASFGDAAEDGQLVLAPNPEASVADWWRADLEGCRVRAWDGEVGADGLTVDTAEQIADLLIDGIERVQQAGGEDLLVLDLVGRGEKLFLTNEGNVCSDRFHQSVWPGELGMVNCTDVVGFVAWGTASPPRGTSGARTPGGGSWGQRDFMTREMAP